MVNWYLVGDEETEGLFYEAKFYRFLKDESDEEYALVRIRTPRSKLIGRRVLISLALGGTGQTLRSISAKSIPIIISKYLETNALRGRLKTFPDGFGHAFLYKSHKEALAHAQRSQELARTEGNMKKVLQSVLGAYRRHAQIDLAQIITKRKLNPVEVAGHRSQSIRGAYNIAFRLAQRMNGKGRSLPSTRRLIWATEQAAKALAHRRFVNEKRLLTGKAIHGEGTKTNTTYRH